jgi:hypothetical protein
VFLFLGYGWICYPVIIAAKLACATAYSAAAAADFPVAEQDADRHRPEGCEDNQETQ